MTAKASIPTIRSGSFAASGTDALVLVGSAPWDIAGLPPGVRTATEAHLAVDPGLGRGQTAVLACPGAPGGRVVLALTGDLAHWTDDVRRFGEAAAAGVAHAVRCGARVPVVAVATSREPRFDRAPLVAAGGAIAATWRHPQLRSEAVVDEIVFAGAAFDEALLGRSRGLEAGRQLARDLIAGDPEFTSPERFAATCERAFEGTAVQVRVDRDGRRIVKDNPLLGAVCRASMAVERHHPRIIELIYDGGEGPHYFFAGKGVTYDTGGADLKVNGAMAGMSGDKGGAAGVAGFFATLAAARPKGLRATALLGMVRNSIGSDSYVADEIIVSRGGVRVLVGNTDAEGRMVLGDLLAVLRERAAEAADPVVFSVATLTGHVGRAYGHYAAVMANGSAAEQDWPRRLQAAGDLFGDPFEWSSIRRDDYEMIAPKTAGGPIQQCVSSPSVNTPRGHQFPFCFLERVSGLDRHDVQAAKRIPYLHLDVAYSVTHKGGVMDGQPSGSPVATLSGALLGW